MTAPLVSIVVPAFNAQRYVRETIESLLAQDYAPLEIIAVDDGSTDRTREILESYGSALQCISQANAGQSSALNRGWSLSHGTILSYLSADDLLRPAAVRRAVETLQQRTSAVAVYPDYDWITPESRVLRRGPAPEFDYRALVTRMVLPPGPGAFFRREAFERTGGWDARYRQMPDVDFWLRMAELGEIVRIPEKLAGFRAHPRSMSFSRTTTELADEPIRIFDELYRHPSAIAAPYRAEALCCAHIVAARAHLRAGRLVTALRRLGKAWRYSRSGVVSGHTLHQLASGVMGRTRARINWMLQRGGERW